MEEQRFFSFFFILFIASPAAYTSSQAGGHIGAAAARLHHSHSNAGSKPHLCDLYVIRQREKAANTSKACTTTYTVIRNLQQHQTLGFLGFLSFFFFLRAARVAYGGSQARSQIRAVATDLHHRNTRSKLCLQTTPQLTATDP